ncbi:MAG TPA: sugar ABC transporter permease [Anaerolineaceae bacterium]|nr:sugar ABC transporter permease [Anaerolineaceae bacterium]
MLKKTIKSNEFITFSIIVLLSLIIGIINPAFFSLATVFDVLRASIVPSIMAFGLLLVIIAGGVDISFVAFAALGAYGTHMLLLHYGYQGGILLYYIIACAIGLLAGSLSGFIITRFDVPMFDVSLATFTLWYGFIRFFIGSAKNFQIPEGAVGYYAKFITTVKDPFVGEAGLHISVIYVLVIGVLIHILLKYTTLGRGIYAIGGNKDVAIRSGFNVRRIILIIYMILGVLSAFAGVTQSFLSRHFEPTLFMTQNLDVIAAVILGGASINGGRGSVLGTFLGVVLMQLINRAMVLTGITVEWQELVIGLVLTIFISLPAMRDRINKKTRHPVEIPDEI